MTTADRLAARLVGGALALLLVGLVAGAVAGAAGRLLTDEPDAGSGDPESAEDPADGQEASGGAEEPEAADESGAPAPAPERSGASDASPAAELRVSAAYVAYWDQERGLAETERNADLLTEVSPWWYGLAASGEVIVQHEGVIDVDRDAVEGLQDRGLEVIPTIANHVEGSWTRVVSDVLADPELRRRHVDSVAELVEQGGYDGIDIDYEDLAADDRKAFSAFVEELGEALDDDAELAVAVHPKTDPAGVDGRNVAQSYRAIGAAADQVRVMAYDRHWSGSGPGPVAPIDWVRNVMAFATSRIPSERVVLGIGAFGYDWERGGGQAAELTIEEAQELAAEQGAEIEWDDEAASPHFSYVDADGQEHTVWFEDERSIRAKLRLVDEYDLGGVFVWRMGGNVPAIWEALREVRA